MMRTIEYRRGNREYGDKVCSLLMHNGLNPEIVPGVDIEWCDERGVLFMPIIPITKDRKLIPGDNVAEHLDFGLLADGYPVIEVKLHRPPWEFGVLDHPAVHEMKLQGIDAPAVSEGAL